MAVSARTVKLALLLGLALLGGLAIFGHARLRHSEWQLLLGGAAALLAYTPWWCWGGGEGTPCQSS